MSVPHSTSTQDEPFHSHEWLVVPQENCIEKDGSQVQLEPRLMRLLTTMAAHRGQVMSKNALIQHIWEGQHVANEVVSVAIYELRKALGDKARQPRFIKTIRSRGFQWIAPVEPVIPATTAVATTPATGSVETGANTTPGGQDTPTDKNALGAAPVTPTPRPHPASSTNQSPLTPLRLVSILIALCALTAVVIAVWPKSSPTRMAILPFKPGSSDDNLRYFAAGLTEALINDLAGHPEIRVLPYHAVESLMDTPQEPASALRELGVETAVWGNIHVRDNQVHVAAHYGTRGQPPRWSKSYTAPIKHFYRLQHELSRDLRIVLVNADPQQPAPHYEALAPDLYHAYLRGRYVLNRGGPRDIAMAVNFFKMVLKGAPDYGPAHAGLLHCYLIYGHLLDLSPQARLDRAAPHLAVLSDGPSAIAEAEVLRGIHAFFYGNNPVQARAAFQRARALHPTSPLLHQWWALFLVANERMDAAHADLERALALDPVEPNLNATMGFLLYLQGRSQAANTYFDQALAIQPERSQWRLWRMLGQRAARQDFAATDRQWLADLLADPQIAARQAPCSTVDLAAWLVGEDQAQRALSLLDAAFQQQDPWRWSITVLPDFQAIHNLPRYQQLHQELKRRGS